MTLVGRKTKRAKAEQKTVMKAEKRRVVCWFKHCLGGQEVLPDDWTTTHNLCDQGGDTLGVSCGTKVERRNETWGWNKEVH